MGRDPDGIIVYARSGNHVCMSQILDTNRDY